jgi:hypothetical protein
LRPDVDRSGNSSSVFSRADYDRLARPRYGATNPERIDNPMWVAAISASTTAYQVRKQHDDTSPGAGVGSASSNYRDHAAGPVWTWQRFGRTSTRLPDGRLIYIGGEHEDWYDIDFCIYNDVVVEHPDGRWEIFGYPKDVFPPTDFHTATLVDETIWIVGNLGYRDLRKPGETQLFTLDTRTLIVERIWSDGDCPGWLHRHWAELIGGREIVVGGGSRTELSEEGKEALTSNRACFALDLGRRTWRHLEQAGTVLLGISAEDYHRFKSPRSGATNPERVNNPFWSAMVRRGLPPRRARDLFADHGREPTEEERKSIKPTPRPIEEVVWTAAREDQAEIVLDNGSRLSVGGTFRGYGLDAIDNWVYSDAILVRPDGSIEFFLYPREVLPALHGLHVTKHDGRVLLSGTPDRTLAAHWPQFRSIMLELDLETFALRRIGGPGNTPEDMLVGPGRPEAGAPSRLIFPLIRRWKSDPVREAVLDLATETWSMRVVSPG